MEGVHEPIVTHEEFEKANEAIRRKKPVRFKGSQEYALKGKARCGNCRRCLYYERTTYKEYFVCRHGRQIGEYSDCCTEQYPVKQVDSVVWKALKDHISMLESLGLKAADKAKKQVKAAKISRTSMVGEIEKLKAEKIRQYEFYANGSITKEQYLRKKAELIRQIEDLEADIKTRNEEIDHQNELWESASNLKDKANGFSGEEKLTRKMVEAFIENVYIYDPDRIEIIFKHEDEIARLAKSLAETDL